MAARLLLVALLPILFLRPERADALAMQISNISDISPPIWSIGDPAIQSSMDICIYGLNIPAVTSYAITVSSTPNNYRIASGGNFIPYSLFWEDSGAGNLGSNGGTQLSDGVKLTLRHNHDVLFANCALAGPNARLTFKISQADMNAALSGTYTGTITLLLTPN